MSGTDLVARTIGRTDGEYRSSAARVVVPALGLLAACWVAVLVLRGEYRQARDAAVWSVALVTGAYLLFYRPAVIVGPWGVALRNPVRDVAVPWEALVEVRTRFALTLITVDGDYVSWAAAAPGRPMVVGSSRKGLQAAGVEPAPRVTGGLSGEAGGWPTSMPASRGLNGDAGAAAVLVESAWERWRLESRRDVGAGERGTRPDGRDEDAGDGEGDGRRPEPAAITVAWHPLPAFLGLAALTAAVLLAVL